MYSVILHTTFKVMHSPVFVSIFVSYTHFTHTLKFCEHVTAFFFFFLSSPSGHAAFFAGSQQRLIVEDTKRHKHTR